GRAPGPPAPPAETRGAPLSGRPAMGAPTLTGPPSRVADDAGPNAGASPQHARQPVGWALLPLAVDAREPHDLAGRHGQAHHPGGGRSGRRGGPPAGTD